VVEAAGAKASATKKKADAGADGQYLVVVGVVMQLVVGHL